jgi:hypothetical protein
MNEVQSCRFIRKTSFLKVIGSVMLIQRWYRTNKKRKEEREILYRKRFRDAY